MTYDFWHIRSETFYVMKRLLGGVSLSGLIANFATKKDKLARTMAIAMIIVIEISLFIIDHIGIWKEQDVNVYKKGHVYFGPMRNGTPYGDGHLFDKDNRLLYIGDFQNGSVTGEGTYYAYDEESNTVYEETIGTFYKSHNAGHVVAYICTGGELKLDFEGNYVAEEGDGGKIYSHKEGEGTEYWYDPEGNVEWMYTGNYENSKFSGKGKYIHYYNDGTIEWEYSGSFKDNEYDGYGEYIAYFKDGSVNDRFRGEYRADKENGLGIHEFHGGSVEYGDLYVHVGNFVNDVFEGEGVTYPAGDKYSNELSGIFKDNRLVVWKDLTNKYPYPSDCIWDLKEE